MLILLLLVFFGLGFYGIYDFLFVPKTINIYGGLDDYRRYQHLLQQGYEHNRKD